MSEFYKSSISDILKEDMKHKNIWNENCPVHIDDLTLLTITYIDFSGNLHNDGKLIIHSAYADNALNIFKILFQQKFPIHSIKLMNDYNGDDNASMADNNSSAFNFRMISGSNVTSIHSYGLAIDINPLQNPYLIIEEDKITAYPTQGTQYLNRKNLRAGMVENIVDIFKENGFDIWGGDWNSPIDWHHFQTSREVAEKIIAKKI